MILGPPDGSLDFSKHQGLLVERRKFILENDPKKQTINKNTTMLGDFPVSRKVLIFGVMFQNEFSPKAVQPEAPGV